jgi:hypothetical protein
MLPLNRETLLMVVAVVCVAISLYLYKELNKTKAELILLNSASPTHKPVSPAPVNDVNKRKPILVKKSVTVKEPPAEEEAVEAELTE